MSIKFNNTHAISILVILLIFIFLIEPNIFGNMINTFLGRFTLLFILIIITNNNVVFGLISVLLIIALYEYYSKYYNLNPFLIEGMENNESKNNNINDDTSYSIVPTNDNSSTEIFNGPNYASKSETENQIQKGLDSKQINYDSVNNLSYVEPSESTITSSVASKQGFANMFGNEYLHL